MLVGFDRNSGVGFFDIFVVVMSFVLECFDGFDNDGDGFFDTLDVGCADVDDLLEWDVLFFCDDGEDDDGDGFVDYFEDFGCCGLIFECEDLMC